MPNRHLTVRAIVTGMLLGAVLTPCNVYSGLKIGWSFNISIIALLIASGFWALLARLELGRAFGVGEANISQTTASSSANIISGGLVAPIPALAMLSGSNLPVGQLVPWVFAVSFLGIWVAWYLRESLILRSGLPFPTGRATAETLLEIFEQDRESALKLRVLLSGTALAGARKWLDDGWLNLPRPSLGFLLPATGQLSGFGGISAKNLTFTLDPSLMLAGFGAIIGFRAGVSLLLGGSRGRYRAGVLPQCALPARGRSIGRSSSRRVKRGTSAGGSGLGTPAGPAGTANSAPRSYHG